MATKYVVHDQQCETEYVPEATAWTPCGCQQRLAAHDQEVRERVAREIEDLRSRFVDMDPTWEAAVKATLAKAARIARGESRG